MHPVYCSIIKSNPGVQIYIFMARITVFCPGPGTECPAEGGKMTALLNHGIPLEAQYLYRQALDRSMEGKKEDALRYLKKVVLIAPHFSNAYNAMGNCLDELGQYEDAIRKYDKVLTIDPLHAEARFKRMLVMEKIRQSDEVNRNAGKSKVPEKKQDEHITDKPMGITQNRESALRLMRIGLNC